LSSIELEVTVTDDALLRWGKRIKVELLQEPRAQDHIWIGDLLTAAHSASTLEPFTSDMLAGIIANPSEQLYVARCATGGIVGLMLLEITDSEVWFKELCGDDRVMEDIQTIMVFVETAIQHLFGIEYSGRTKGPIQPREPIDSFVPTHAKELARLHWLVVMSRELW
jgi:hypothetical protein